VGIKRVSGLFILFYLLSARAEVITGIDDTAQLPFWEWRNDYMTLRLIQRLPDQTRAYFSGRGFKPNAVNTIAGYCIFQTVYTNTSGPIHKKTIQHDIHNWRYHRKGNVYPMKPREEWKPFWQEKGVAQAQIVAFEWSLFPTRQVFEAGDYNWGMSVFNVPHGDSFDLELSWKVDGKPQSATINNVTCAKDIYIPPQ
jgi:hypothetical protein